MILIASLLLAPPSQVSFSPEAPKGHYDYAVSNRAPLSPDAFTKLPIGAIRPNGWIRKQLELEANGFTGRLEEISPWLRKSDNAWISPTGKGEHGWEETPYWLKGYGDLGYVLSDKRITEDAKQWVQGVLSSRRPNGYFGPESNLTANNGKPDVWPNMVMLSALRSYYEYTPDKRVLDLMSAYFKWELTIPDKDFLLSYWEPQRVGDNIDSIYWLYNRTGDKSLFDVVEKLHKRGAKWSQGVADWHGVNMSQAFREPAEYGELHHDPALTAATENDYQTIRNKYGQVPGGGYGADENARPGFGDPRQATETCTWAELMLSDELLLKATGSIKWAERCEDIAFNSLPASMTADLTSLHYLTSPNMVQIDKGSKAPDLQNSGPMLLFNAYDHRCCQHNVSHAWPYYAEHLWMGAANNGLAAIMYGPSKVTAKAGNGGNVTIEERTEYPFEDTVIFRVSSAKANHFPLVLRWPTWCAKPYLAVNGHKLEVKGTPGGYLTIDRTWQNQDNIALGLPATVKTVSWPGNKNAISVQRGPLSYSLKIGEKYVRAGGTNQFPSYEVYPTTAWNYGLVTSGQKFTVTRKDFPSSEQPFTTSAAPLEIRAQARKIPEWQMDRLKVVGLLQDLPAQTASPIETVTLIPMGAARLRVSEFPTVSPSQTAHKWVAPVRGKDPIPASASHVFGGDTVDALSDGLLPKNSVDQSIPRFTWWSHKGTTEWVEYDFPTARKLSHAGVYWFDDEPINGGCRVPESWRLLYKRGAEWVEVAARGAYGVEANRMNTVDFDSIATRSIRLEVKLKPSFSGGILEWQIR